MVQPGKAVLLAISLHLAVAFTAECRVSPDIHTGQNQEREAGKALNRLNITPIHEGPGSSMIAYNGTCPESPDGQRIAYYVQERAAGEEPEPVAGAMWVCTRDFEDHRKVADLSMKTPGFEHNGAQSCWVDNHRIAFRETGGEGNTIRVVDVDSGKPVTAPVVGSIGHYAAAHLLPFAISPAHEGKNPAHPAIDEPGIYVLDCDSGVVAKVIANRDVVAFLASQGGTVDEKPPHTGGAHFQLNYSGTRVMARWGETLFSCDLDGANKAVCRDKPLHQLWYDDETYYGVNRRTNPWRMARFSQDGTLIEILAGVGNHIHASPDREWYVTDSWYHRSPVFIELYRKGETTARMRLDEHTFIESVWRLRAHANPVFSRDGKRVYFNQGVSDDRVRAVCVDISEVIQSGSSGGRPRSMSQEEEKKLFEEATKGRWQEALSDSCTNDWREKWFLDGEIGTVNVGEDGMTLTAGPEYKNDAHHMVLWTKDEFTGDLKIEYDWTRRDDRTGGVNILYIQATGSGEEGFGKDITTWNDKRTVPHMWMYFKNMNTYHISYAAFTGNATDSYIRGRRYMPHTKKLRGFTELVPEYTSNTLFAKGVKHDITVIKKDRILFMKIENGQETMYCHMENINMPIITEGRIGLRHMYTRSSTYKNFSISTAAE